MEKLISIKELFKKSWSMYVARWWNMLLLGLVGWTGSMVIIGVFGLGAFGAVTLGDTAFPFTVTTMALALVGIFLLIVVNIWIQLTLMHVVKTEHMQGSVWNTLMMVWNSMASYAWVVVMKGLVVLAGFILFVIPGIIFSVWFAFSEYAFVADGNRGRRALEHSRELVRGYWWPILGRLAPLAVAPMLVSLVTTLDFLINSLVVMPFSLVYLYILYNDLKRAKNASLPMKAEMGRPQ